MSEGRRAVKEARGGLGSDMAVTGKSAREARLAAALRDNLRRRKARGTGDAASAAPEAPAPGDQPAIALDTAAVSSGEVGVTLEG